MPGTRIPANNRSRLPIASLIVVVVSSLTFLAIIGDITDKRGVLFLACVGAMVGVVLGIIGFMATRGEDAIRRVPAVIAMMIGGISFLWMALVLWLSTPF